MDWLEQMSQQELEQFKHVCNYLLGHTFVNRVVYKLNDGFVRNPDYFFLSTNFENVQEYLYYLDWELHRNDFDGYFYITNTGGTNRLRLNKIAVLLLLALRKIYEQRDNDLGPEREAKSTVEEAVEMINDFASLKTTQDKNSLVQAFNLLEYHNVVQRGGREPFKDGKCAFFILPSIVSVVPVAKLNEMVSLLEKGKEDSDEEDNPESLEEDLAD